MALRLRSHSWPIYLLASLIVVIAAVTLVGERGALHLWRLLEEKSRLDAQNYRLQRENEALRRRISRIRNDNHFLEKLAREELNLARPGEVVYRFPPPKSRSAGPRLNEPSSESPPSAGQKEQR